MYYYDKGEAAILMVLDKSELQNRFFEEVTRRLAIGGKPGGDGERENTGNPGMLIFFIKIFTLCSCTCTLLLKEPFFKGAIRT